MDFRENSMGFHIVNIERWERREYFEHYINEVNCSYSSTVSLDISKLKGYKIYPAMIWLLTKTVNAIEQFRTALKGDLVGIYDSMHPAFTIFNEETKHFSSVWTEFSDEYSKFYNRYLEITERFRHSDGFEPQKDRPENTFNISMIPWFTFSSFNLNIHNGGRYLLPIFTMGKIFEMNGKSLLPLSIQVHHAVCDGYHVALFIKHMQDNIRDFPGSSY